MKLDGDILAEIMVKTDIDWKDFRCKDKFVDHQWKRVQDMKNLVETLQRHGIDVEWMDSE